MPLTPGILEVDPLATRRLAEAEAEVKRLRELAKTAGDQRSRERSARHLPRSRCHTPARFPPGPVARRGKPTCRHSAPGLPPAPVENEMKALNQRIAGLEQEREAMAMALTQSRSAHTEALARNRHPRGRSQGDAAKARRSRPRPQGRAQRRQLGRRRPARANSRRSKRNCNQKNRPNSPRPTNASPA